MALQIPILGIGPDWKLPGAYAEILFGQGPASAFAPGRTCCLVMPKLSTGTWTVNTRYAISKESDVITGAGAGSPLHRAARKFLTHNKDTKLFAVPYAASSGGSPATATATLTIANNATAPGTLTVFVDGEPCSASYITGDTPTIIGGRIAESISGKTHLPCTAADSTGTTTLTAKIAGASQGDGTLHAHRLHVEITAGTAVTATIGAALGTATAGADGTTTEAANLATALAVLDMVRDYYIGISLQTATAYGHLKTHISTKSEPRRGLRSHGFAAYTGALAAAQTLAIGRNYERLSMPWQPNSEHDPAEIVGAIMAIVSKREGVFSAYNFDGYSLSDILLNAYATSDWPDPEDLNDAINDGLMPIGSSDAGPSIVMATTTRSKNSAGTIDDPRALERHRASVCDEFVDEEIVANKLNFSGKQLADNTAKEKQLNALLEKRPANVVTPIGFKPHLNQRLDDYADIGGSGKLQEVAASKESLRVVKTGSRLEVGCQLHVIDQLHISSYLFSEVSTG
jgi:phage tail sheath gpL-like